MNNYQEGRSIVDQPLREISDIIICRQSDLPNGVQKSRMTWVPKNPALQIMLRGSNANHREGSFCYHFVESFQRINNGRISASGKIVASQSTSQPHHCISLCNQLCAASWKQTNPSPPPLALQICPIQVLSSSKIHLATFATNPHIHAVTFPCCQRMTPQFILEH